MSTPTDFDPESYESEAPPAPTISGAGSLNPAQRAAVEHRDGPLAIIAGPGSGKTRVITHRIAYLIGSGVEPPGILAITFTNRAAKEMLRRTLELLAANRNFDGGDVDDRWNRPTIATFHSFCAQLLRREIYRIEPYQTNYTIYDTADQEHVIAEAIEAAKLERGTFKARSCLDHISRYKTELLGPSDVADEAQSDRERSIAKIYAGYQALLEQRNALDFDDLLILTLRVLSEHDDVLERRRQQHRYLLVDEFQDTNRPQYLIARMLSSEHGNLAITGDPDQSIYSWRGADPRNFEDFQTDFPEHETVLLNQNYRSTPEIINSASRLTDGAVGRRDLFTENASGELVHIRNVANEREEARQVALRIAQLYESGASLNEIVVLYRTNSLSRSIEEALIRATIPYSLVGGVAFYQRREIKDIICYLRAATIPRDDLALKRIINVPPRGFGKRSLERFEAETQARNLTLGSALEDSAVLDSLPTRARKALEQLREVLAEIRRQQHLALSDRVAEAIRLTSYEAYLEQFDPERFDDRCANLSQLINAAEETEQLIDNARVDSQREQHDELRVFLERIALVSEIDELGELDDRVTLMTLHSVKGLEFDHVIIIGVEHGLLPHMRNQELGDIDEDRRLLYVGMTRARLSLDLFHTNWRRQFRESEVRTPSPFLREIAGPEVEWLERDHGGGQRKRSGLGTRSTGFNDAGFADYDRGDPGPKDEWEDYTIDEGAFGDGGDDYYWDPDAAALIPGCRIEHDIFGAGRLDRISGVGNAKRLFIDFDEHGMKQLLAAATEIRIISAPDDA